MSALPHIGIASSQNRRDTAAPVAAVRPGAAQAPPKVDRVATAGPVQQPAATQQPKAAPTQEELQKLATAIQQKFSAVSTDLQFSVDSESGKSIVTMTDKRTKEVVWQFPSEEAMKLAKAMDQYQKGQMISRTA
ncbi:MAG: flagellar protein FlaG [Burkholderiales bacterium]